MKRLELSLPCGNRDHNPACLPIPPHSTYLVRDFSIVYCFSTLFLPLGRFKFLEPLKDYPTFYGLLLADLRTPHSKVFTTFCVFNANGTPPRIRTLTCRVGADYATINTRGTCNWRSRRDLNADNPKVSCLSRAVRYHYSTAP